MSRSTRVGRAQAGTTAAREEGLEQVARLVAQAAAGAEYRMRSGRGVTAISNGIVGEGPRWAPDSNRPPQGGAAAMAA